MVVVVTVVGCANLRFEQGQEALHVMEFLGIGRHLHAAAVHVHALDLVKDQLPVALAAVIVRSQELPEYVEIGRLVVVLGAGDENQPFRAVVDFGRLIG